MDRDLARALWTACALFLIAVLPGSLFLGQPIVISAVTFAVLAITFASVRVWRRVRVGVDLRVPLAYLFLWAPAALGLPALGYGLAFAISWGATPVGLFLIERIESSSIDGVWTRALLWNMPWLAFVAVLWVGAAILGRIIGRLWLVGPMLKAFRVSFVLQLCCAPLVVFEWYSGAGGALVFLAELAFCSAILAHAFLSGVAAARRERSSAEIFA